MKFYRTDEFSIYDDLPDDSRDCLDCFGEFSRHNPVCLKYCADSIMCAVEHDQNPTLDILEHFLSMELYSARMN
ncbi:MAG: hypothetical protein HQK66_13020 [Desulfamplus sp.]|nr:hypothetical protein [Desulfamplus sp.]